MCIIFAEDLGIMKYYFCFPDFWAGGRDLPSHSLCKQALNLPLVRLFRLVLISSVYLKQTIVIYKWQIGLGNVMKFRIVELY